VVAQQQGERSNMIYEFRTYTLKPRTMPAFFKAFEEKLEGRQKYSKLAACWQTEIGPLNQVTHVWGYENAGARDKVRTEAAQAGVWPPKVGDYILLRISNVSETDFNTLTLLGLPMKVVAKDARLLRGPTGKNLYYNTSSVTLGGGESIDVIVDTRTAVAGKTYYIYAARFTQLCNNNEDFGGIMTYIKFAP